MRLPRRRINFLALLLAGVTLILTGCGGSDADSAAEEKRIRDEIDSNSLGPQLESEGGKADALASAIDAPLEPVEVGGKRYLVGHGVSLEIPSSFVNFPNSLAPSPNEPTMYSYGLPIGADNIPQATITLFLGPAGDRPPIDDLAAQNLRAAKSQPGFKLLDEESVDVPGAKEALMTRSLGEQTRDETFEVEEVNLYIQVDDTTLSLLRFSAPVGKFDERLKTSLDSVRVAVEPS